MTRRQATLIAALIVTSPAVKQASARADDPLPQRVAGVAVKNGQLLISVGLQDLFGAAERQHLTSGFSTRVLIRVALQDASREQGDPLALAVQRAEIVYDIWDERFSVRVPRRRAARDRADRRRGDRACERAVAVPDRRRESTAQRRPIRRPGARRPEPDLGGSAGRRAALAGAAGARAAAPGRRRQLLRIVRQHLRQPAHRRQRATGPLRVPAVHAARPAAARSPTAAGTPGARPRPEWT